MLYHLFNIFSLWHVQVIFMFNKYSKFQSNLKEVICLGAPSQSEGFKPRTRLDFFFGPSQWSNVRKVSLPSEGYDCNHKTQWLHGLFSILLTWLQIPGFAKIFHQVTTRRTNHGTLFENICHHATSQNRFQTVANTCKIFAMSLYLQTSQMGI